jgi:hypothetical protein
MSLTTKTSRARFPDDGRAWPERPRGQVGRQL